MKDEPTRRLPGSAQPTICTSHQVLGADVEIVGHAYGASSPEGHKLAGLATLAPFIAGAGIVGGLFGLLSKLVALSAKDESASSAREKLAARLDLVSSAAVTLVGVAALIVVLTS